MLTVTRIISPISTLVTTAPFRVATMSSLFSVGEFDAITADEKISEKINKTISFFIKFPLQIFSFKYIMNAFF